MYVHLWRAFVCIFTKAGEKTKAVMKLQNVANFGPEMSSEILKHPVLCKRMIQKLENHETSAGQQGQAEVAHGRSVSEVHLRSDAFEHSEGDVTTQGYFKPSVVKERQSIAEDRARFHHQGVTGRPAFVNDMTPHQHPRKNR